MITKTWKYGTIFFVEVQMASKDMMAVSTPANEGFILIGHGINPLPKKGEKGTITFTKGGPTGGYWKYEKSILTNINMYSQGKEQEHIIGYFIMNSDMEKRKTEGLLLSIGENDGKTFSNALALIEMGWNAILVEPSPEPYKKLYDLHKENPRVVTFELAIAPEDGDVILHDSGSHLKTGDHGLLSTIIPEEKQRWKDTEEFNEITVKGLTMKTFLEKLPPDLRNFDFISIDAEGMDLMILQQLDLSQTKMLCIEWNSIAGVATDILTYCAKFGMTTILYQNGENLILVK